MSMATSKLRNKLSKLHDSLDKLEGELEPLLAQPLAESLVVLDTIQQAKLQVVIPYVVYDLVFGVLFSWMSHPVTNELIAYAFRVILSLVRTTELVYLKTRGIDPTTHPVVTELVRVPSLPFFLCHVPFLPRRTYTVPLNSGRTAYANTLKKSKRQRDQWRRSVSLPSTEPRTPAFADSFRLVCMLVCVCVCVCTGKAAVDRQAAGRFIKHALAQAQTAEHEGEDEREQEQEQERGPGIEPEPQDGGQSSAAGSSTERVPIKMTSKMLARAEYEQSLRELDDEEEDDLAVFDEDAGVDAEVEEGYQPMEDVDGGLVEPAKDKGKQRMLVGVADESGANQVTTSRRKRPRIDPFTGARQSCSSS